MIEVKINDNELSQAASAGADTFLQLIIDKTRAAIGGELTAENMLERLELPFHKALAAGELPLSIGGGIGQSRLCMLLLQKAHIGEVHASLWPESELVRCRKMGVELL